MKLSIVSTLYLSAPNLAEFHRRIGAAARQLVGDDYELVLVNDGSPDDSLELAMRLFEEDTHLVVVDLSRNFGHHKAAMTGLAHARGERVFLLDSDLEEDPECLVDFWEKMQNLDCDVIYGVQESRKGGAFERWSGFWFYRLFNFLSGLDLPENVVTARLMTRRYVDALLQHGEREVFMAGLLQITGFDQAPHRIVKHHSGQTTYTLRKKLSLLVNSVTSFSNAPLVGIFYVGAAISIFAVCYIGYVIFNWAFLNSPVSGWTSLVASIWLLGGLIISFIGVIGIYLAKIFSETKQRPNTIVRQLHTRAGDSAPRLP